MLEEVSAAPFSAEDSFSQFTSDMVRLMKEEEVRVKHQAGLLRLREKALKEKTRAEMAWLECQKQRHRDKGADDVMPSIRKRQRGVLMRLQAEQVGRVVLQLQCYVFKKSMLPLHTAAVRAAVKIVLAWQNALCSSTK